jgi:hypothetical protein
MAVMMPFVMVNADPVATNSDECTPIASAEPSTQDRTGAMNGAILFTLPEPSVWQRETEASLLTVAQTKTHGVGSGS